MKRLFIHAHIFDNLWKKFNFKDDLLKKLQEEINKNPECGKIIKGTHGLRKMRWDYEGTGKSGGIRVFYLDIPSHEHIHLIYVITIPAMNRSAQLRCAWSQTASVARFAAHLFEQAQTGLSLTLAAARYLLFVF